jgi:Rrf2 family transcriptional regulator, iron-sulfur cluster assembly transcription factor
MSVIFSRQCEYALQAVLYITSKESNGYTDIKEISEKLNIPPHFLAKILQNLSKSGLLKSQKGPSGGFALSTDPDDITLYQIVVAVDGDGFLTDCVLGLPVCDSDNPCPVHDRWRKLRENIYKMLAGKTVGQMSNEMQSYSSLGAKMYFS